MAQLQDVRAARVKIAAANLDRRGLSYIAARPALLFILLSALFGTLTMLGTPPLRGPDELPHFVRAYGLSRGEIVPATFDALGRKGVFLPATLHHDLQRYERALAPLYSQDQATFADVLAEYRRQREAASPPPATPVFTPYAGSEGYSPAPYLPYMPGLALAQILDVDFIATIYLMRMSGFLIITAVMAFAIIIVPHLQWPFVLISLLPSALFSRTVLSADASALAFTMVVAAIALRAAHGLPAGGMLTRALWMSLCVLCKPPQLAFIVVEAMRAPLKRLMRQRWQIVLSLGPAVILALGWVTLSAADVAAWRIVDGSTVPSEHFAPMWKLRFMLSEPWHFPRLLAGTSHYVDDYALQLIGVLGWLDMPLRSWFYPVLGAFLVASFWVPFQLDRSTCSRLVIVAAGTMAGYTFAVFLIFYLVWTGLDSPQIEGVQGRYFVVVLPLLAVIIAGSLKRGLPETTRAFVAIIGAALSSCATLEAVLRADWKVLPI